MKFISNYLKLLPVLLLVIGFQSCSDDDDGTVTPPEETTIVDVAVANGFTSLAAALEATNLVSTLQGDGPFTVFAPTNDAFADLLNATGLDLANLTNEEEELVRNILLNHVIAGEAIQASTLITAGSGYASTQSPGPTTGTTLSLYYNVDGGVVELNGGSDVVDGIGADVTTPDVTASNGIIHVVDAVIGLPSIVDHAINNSDFSSLTASLSSEDLVGALQAEGPFTVFAPTDTAFSNFTNPNSNGLSNILLNHVVNGVTLAGDLVGAGAGYTKTLATGPMDLNMNMPNLSLYFNTSNGVIINGGPEVVATDVIGTNGVIHVVDAVIDLPSVVTFAVADPTFSTLVTALTTATPSTDFVSILSTTNGTSPAPFTIFAPTDDAFAALPGIPAEEDLIPILQHHVITETNAVSGDLTPNGDTMLPTLEGDDITISLPGTDGNIANVEDGSGSTDIGIIAVDVQAANGVIHVLNKVLVPTTN